MSTRQRRGGGELERRHSRCGHGVIGSCFGGCDNDGGGQPDIARTEHDADDAGAGGSCPGSGGKHGCGNHRGATTATATATTATATAAGRDDPGNGQLSPDDRWRQLLRAGRVLP